MGAILAMGALWAAGICMILMLMGWWIGIRIGNRQLARGVEPSTRFADAGLALLGLLLAFTFSFAMTKHDTRRQMVVTDANAIGDYSTTIAMLADPHRARLQAVVKEYVHLRLEFARQHRGEDETQAALKQFADLQNRMTDLTREAIDKNPAVAVPLVNNLNQLTSAHASRLAAIRDRVPVSIEVLLLASGVVAMVLIGKSLAASQKREFFPGLGFTILVSLVVYVTLDLNDPRRGLITVDQEPMQRLYDSLSN